MYNKTLSIVVPAFNEQENILELYNRLKNVLIDYSFEIIFVNDGSNDKSEQMISEIANKDSRVKLINFTRNFGHEAATTAGIEYAKGDAVIVLDADLQDPPEIIPKMVDLWQEGCEVVFAQRSKRQGEPLLKKITSHLFYRFLDIISETHIPKDTGDFRLMDRKVVEDFKKLKEKNRLFRGLATWVGYNQTAIEFERQKRFAGKTKYNYFKLFRLALDSITSFSTKPLFFITILGFFISFLSFIAGIIFIFIKLFYQFPVSGWTSLIITILFLNGFQIFLIGIVGEYIGRMFLEVKDRPLYLIRNIVDTEQKESQEWNDTYTKKCMSSKISTGGL
ncbi:MAG: glycosyltransferase family 2 protein [Ignavibacteriales bacterium]